MRLAFGERENAARIDSPFVTLSPGSRLGSYEISAPIGAGGMGEVFRARDTRLQREVAIKVLPAAFAADPDRVARFRREAQLLASLNHPNVAAIHGLEERDGIAALVLELVDGEDLAARLARGPLPVDEALAIARQLVEGLEAAHERGIVHRDLKPANVKLTPDGTVKILDFGLAKACEEGPPGGTDLSHSPTMSHQRTEAGIILGTAPYMSPEQARGRAVDKRSDIWSFGVVLYEMLTGRRLFAGESVTDVLAAVLRQEVDFSRLPAETPSSVRRLLARCLERDPRRRLRDIGDARLELDPSDPREAAAAAAPAVVRRPLAAVPALLAVALASGAAAWLLKPAPVPKRQPLVRAAYESGSRLGLLIQRRQVAISPDGSTIATVVGSLGTGSWVEVRRVDALAATRIAGTDGARGVFFSPDSRFVGFTTDTAIKKVPVGSGEAGGLAEIGTTVSSGPVGASWADDGLIYFAGQGGIAAVPANGGEVRVVAKSARAYHPWVLPGGRYLLYARGQLPQIFAPGGEVVLRELATGKESVLTTGTSPMWLPNGLLLVARADGVYGAPLSLSERRLARDPVVLVPQVALLGSAAQYDVSPAGTLVYIPGNVMNEPPSLPQRVDASGGTTALTHALHQYSDPRVSPDGSRLALHLQDGENDIWTLDPARDALTRLTFDNGEDETPAWSPDGVWLAYSGTRGEERQVLRRRADGSGPEEVLWKLPEHAHVTDWSPDGRSLLVDVYRSLRRTDIVRLELAPHPAPHPFLETPFDESSGRISPDGRWAAYRSNESERDEIYVQPFPAGGAKVQVSNGGGVQPVWSRDGRALTFRAGGVLMVARVLPGDAIAFQTPRPLFKDTFARPQGAAHTTYDVFPDGSFLFLETSGPHDDASAANRVVVAAFHWLENLDLSARPTTR